MIRAQKNLSVEQREDNDTDSDRNVNSDYEHGQDMFTSGGYQSKKDKNQLCGLIRYRGTKN